MKDTTTRLAAGTLVAAIASTTMIAATQRRDPAADLAEIDAALAGVKAQIAALPDLDCTHATVAPRRIEYTSPNPPFQARPRLVRLLQLAGCGSESHLSPTHGVWTRKEGDGQRNSEERSNAKRGNEPAR